MKEQTKMAGMPRADAVLPAQANVSADATLPISGRGAPMRLAAQAGGEGALRIRSQDLFQQGREIEIDHEGRIYRLRRTQLNKLILTA